MGKLAPGTAGEGIGHGSKLEAPLSGGSLLSFLSEFEGWGSFLCSGIGADLSASTTREASTWARRLSGSFVVSNMWALLGFDA